MLTSPTATFSCSVSNEMPLPTANLNFGSPPVATISKSEIGAVSPNRILTPLSRAVFLSFDPNCHCLYHTLKRKTLAFYMKIPVFFAISYSKIFKWFTMKNCFNIHLFELSNYVLILWPVFKSFSIPFEILLPTSRFLSKISTL